MAELAGFEVHMLRRIFTGDGMRVSRFHDYHGNVIDAMGFVPTTLHCFNLGDPSASWRAADPLELSVSGHASDIVSVCGNSGFVPSW